MKKIIKKGIVGSCLLLLSLGSYAQTELLQAGTSIPIRIQTGIDKNNQNGNFVIANNVNDRNGKVVISAGTKVDCSINYQGPKGVGKGAKLSVNFTQTTTTDGAQVPLSGNYTASGNNKKGKAHGLTWGLFFLGLGPLALPCLAIKGEDVSVPVGTITYAQTTAQVSGK
jgi:hypothetical protein